MRIRREEHIVSIPEANVFRNLEVREQAASASWRQAPPLHCIVRFREAKDGTATSQAMPGVGSEKA